MEWFWRNVFMRMVIRYRKSVAKLAVKRAMRAKIILSIKQLSANVRHCNDADDIGDIITEVSPRHAFVCCCCCCCCCCLIVVICLLPARPFRGISNWWLKPSESLCGELSSVWQDGRIGKSFITYWAYGTAYRWCEIFVTDTTHPND